MEKVNLFSDLAREICEEISSEKAERRRRNTPSAVFQGDFRLSQPKLGVKVVERGLNISS